MRFKRQDVKFRFCCTCGRHLCYNIKIGRAAPECERLFEKPAGLPCFAGKAASAAFRQGCPGRNAPCGDAPFSQRIISAKEAVPIENNEHRNIRRPQNSQSGQSAPRRVNRTPGAGTQRTVNRSAAVGAQRSTGAPRSGGQGSSGAPRSGGHTPKKKKSGVRRFFGGLFRFIAVCICLGVMVASVVAVALSLYLVEATADDNLNLTEVKLAQTTWIMAQDHETGEWVDYEDFYRTNNREWAELSEIESSPYLKWAFICTEDKDFYEHHGVSFKRTIAAAINEYTPIKLFGSRQGASTLEQQLIKNLTGDDEQDAYRKTDQAEPAQMLSGQNPGQHKQNRQRAAQYQTGSGKQTEKDSLTPPAVVFGRQYIGRLAEKRELQHGFQSRQRAIAPFWGVKGPVTKKALFSKGFLNFILYPKCEYSGVAEPCFPLKEPPNIPVKRANLSANESQ